MSIAVHDDGDRIGHAVLVLDPARSAPLAVSLRFPDRTYLGADGRRSRGRHLFAAEALDPGGTRFRLGPQVTAHMREAEIVTIVDADGAELGTVGWDGIRAPPDAAKAGLVLAGGTRRGASSRGMGAPVPARAAATPGTLPGAPGAAEPIASPAPLPRPRSRSRLVRLLPLALLVALALAALLVGRRHEAAPLVAPPVPVATPAPAPARPSGVDDALCDKLAGNRFDPDHPDGRPARDEIFDLAADLEAAGLAACDPRPDRGGTDRRFLVQRGRLLAERARGRLAAGDVAAATAAMDDAVAAWRRGDSAGSAYAANLLGAYYNGSFNQPSHAFFTPDDATAARYWLEGMRRGSAVAQRNYAADLLMAAALPPSRLARWLYCATRWPAASRARPAFWA